MLIARYLPYLQNNVRVKLRLKNYGKYLSAS